MKKFTVEQKLSAIKDYEVGNKVAEICRKHNVNPNTIYKWKAKYEEAGIDGLAPKVINNVISSKESELRRENEELKKLLGERISNKNI